MIQQRYIFHLVLSNINGFYKNLINVIWFLHEDKHMTLFLYVCLLPKLWE